MLTKKVIIFIVFLLGTISAIIVYKLTEKMVIDANYAAKVAKKILSLSGPVAAQELKGGLSQVKLFVVTTDDKKYVVRFLSHKTPEKSAQEMQSLLIASQTSYGPQVYVADQKQAVIIMEYITPEKLTYEQRESEQLYKTLGELLRKMHTGPKFKKTLDVFERVKKSIQWLKSQKDVGLDASNLLANLENYITTISQVVAPYVIYAPCHNDLNPNNLLFLGGFVKAIDYETAAQADPYFDIATITNFYLLNPTHEKSLLTAYLEREPSLKEEARLYVMKQVVLINYALIVLELTRQKISLYKTSQVPLLEDWLREFYCGNVDMENPENQVKYVKVLLAQIFANLASQEFDNAIKLLREK